jgi:hypothetical protein
MHLALDESFLPGPTTNRVRTLLHEQRFVSGDQVGGREATGKAGLKLFRREGHG